MSGFMVSEPGQMGVSKQGKPAEPSSVRSKVFEWLWNTSAGSHFYVIRLCGAVLFSFLLVLRAGRLFLRARPAKAPVIGLLFVGVLFGGLLNTLVVGTLVSLAYLFFLLVRQPLDNVGHRAGAKGFSGPCPENTVEALQALIARDLRSPISGFHYVEFDVHETQDGELVVLHDLHSLLEASKTADINKGAIAALRQLRPDLKGLRVHDVTLQQLRGIHIGGNKGIHAPLLADFVGVCRSAGLKRSIAAEVKSIVTEGGRRKFLELLRTYKLEYCSQLEQECPQRKYAQLGWVAAISFPFMWAASFGEFCTPEWQHWAERFREAGIPVRSCVLHSLDLIPPLR